MKATRQRSLGRLGIRACRAALRLGVALVVGFALEHAHDGVLHGRRGTDGGFRLERLGQMVEIAPSMVCSRRSCIRTAVSSGSAGSGAGDDGTGRPTSRRSCSGSPSVENARSPRPLAVCTLARAPSGPRSVSGCRRRGRRRRWCARASSRRTANRGCGRSRPSDRACSDRQQEVSEPWAPATCSCGSSKPTGVRSSQKKRFKT